VVVVEGQGDLLEVVRTRGHVNLSPKGPDTFRVLGPRRVACLDLTGSGVETVAHPRENGRRPRGSPSRRRSTHPRS
jgi:hypothetical protein